MPSDKSRIAALEEKVHRLAEERDAALAQVRESREAQAEKADELRRSHQRLSEAESLSHTGVWEWDVTSDRWMFSDEWLSIHGCPERPLVPDDLLQIAHPDDRAAIERAFKDVRNGVAPYHLEHRIVRPDGSVRHIRAHGQYVRNSSGKVIKVYGFAQDITEQKRAEEELQRAHALIEGIAVGTEDMIAAEDGEFRYLFFNEAYRREFKALWGLDIEVGASMIEALAPWPEEQRKARELWSRALAGESFQTRMEFGSEREKRIYDLHFNPLHDARLQIGAAHILRNVTEQVRLQQALAEREEHARRIIDNLVALVGVLTPDGTLIEANALALRAGRLRREDVVGKKFWDCYWWSYDARVQQRLRDAVAAAGRGERVRYDVVVRTAGDGRLWIDFMLAPARNSAGQITHLIPSALDITERKRGEQALRESEDRLKQSEERYRTLFTKMTEGFALGEPILDEEGRPRDFRFLEINEAFKKQTGLSPVIIGQPASVALPKLEPFWIETYCTVALEGEPAHFEQFNRDTGRWYDVYCYRPVEGRFAILFRDITENRQIQEILRESEEKYRSLFENIDEGFCIIEMIFDAAGRPADYRFLETNPSFEKQTGLVHARGKTIRDFAPELEEHWFEIYGRIALTGQPERFENRAEQLRRWFDVFAFRHGRPENRQVAILFNDITERKEVEKELAEAKAAAEAASQAKSEFLANMSHEIRTPMTVFMAAIEYLLQIDRHPERRDLLGMADHSAKRLRSLIDEILDFSRIEARKMEIEEEPFDLRTCVREAVDMFTLPAREKRLRLETEVAEEVPAKIVGDLKRVGQVLINLIGNAVKFTREGEIRVCVRPLGDLLEFSVADTGIGIPKDKHHLLFDSFSQVDSSFTRQHGGSGLGLAISKGLVELMGGKISVHSRLGEGSTFIFTLPLKSVDQPNSAPVEAPRKELRAPTSAIRILLAEDEPKIRQMIATILARKGMHIDIAATGKEALAKWAAGDFDIILMDLQMPEMSGMEATRAIRQREAAEGRCTCIIGLTAHAHREIREDCLASGMDHVLTKPVQMSDLFSMIESCLPA